MRKFRTVAAVAAIAAIALLVPATAQAGTVKGKLASTSVVQLGFSWGG
ncbi:MAG TPA: hypothetical protein VES93_08050 [Ornithinibacter sp.]|nr:hypothetical protein [Ornithinibacter sp.]